MGVFLHKIIGDCIAVSLPHARGGVSSIVLTMLITVTSSPRTWGCFSTGKGPVLVYAVFPTHVGVFLLCRRMFLPVYGLPHARGGVSDLSLLQTPRCESSPRTWGCFLTVWFLFLRGRVFPTHVGVFLPLATSTPSGFGLPHARGGVSMQA